MKNDIGSYVIVRSARAGVFAGELAARNGQEVELNNARRIWYWDGAASLSQMAISGVSKPKNCKFSVATAAHTIFEVIEIIPCTDEARKSIEGVLAWQV
jgi:hypothetical protein